MHGNLIKNTNLTSPYVSVLWPNVWPRGQRDKLQSLASLLSFTEEGYR